jgi:hypothetical protein
LVGVSRTDTTPELAAVQQAAWQRMGADGRVALAVEMSEELRLISLDGLRERHPEANHDDLIVLLIELWHGPDVAREVVARRDR